MAGRGRKGGAGSLALLSALTLVGPLVLFLAAFGTRSGWWSLAVGYDLLALTIGRWLALVGLAAGLLALVLSLRRPRRLVLVGLAALAVGIAFSGLTFMQHQRLARGGPGDATTFPAEPPPFSDAMRGRSAAGLGQPQSCPQVQAVPSQLAAESVGDALRRAGFTVTGSGAFQVEGTHTGYWFGFTHDVTVRIRPGRTDARVTARSDREQGPQACDLLARIMAELAEAP